MILKFCQELFKTVRDFAELREDPKVRRLAKSLRTNIATSLFTYRQPHPVPEAAGDILGVVAFGVLSFGAAIDALWFFLLTVTLLKQNRPGAALIGGIAVMLYSLFGRWMAVNAGKNRHESKASWASLNQTQRKQTIAIVLLVLALVPVVMALT